MFGGTALTGVGWVFHGDRVRPVVALDLRYAPRLLTEYAVCEDACGVADCGGSGILLSAGAQVGRRGRPTR